MSRDVATQRAKGKEETVTPKPEQKQEVVSTDLTALSAPAYKPRKAVFGQGHKGDDVLWLQKELNKWHTSKQEAAGKRVSKNELIRETGYFGDNTLARLTAYQKENNVPGRLGVFGPNTLRSLNNSKARTDQTSATPDTQSTAGALTVQNITQAKVALDRFYKSNWNYKLAQTPPPPIPTGAQLDPKTKELVEGFQITQNLPVTGALDPRTMKALENPKTPLNPLVGLPVLKRGGSIEGKRKDIPAIRITPDLEIHYNVAPSAAAFAKDLQRSGFPLRVTYSFRSTDLQAQMYARYCARVAKGEKDVSPVAPPGSSMHEGAGAIDWTLKKLAKNESERQLIARIGAKHGWRNLASIGEPWHYDNKDYRSKEPIKYDPDTGLKIASPHNERQKGKHHRRS